MKKNTFKKSFLSVLLILAMLVTFASVTAFADEQPTLDQLDVILEGYGYGNPINQVYLTPADTTAQFSYRFFNDNTKISTSSTSLVEPVDSYFHANEQYYMVVKFSANDLDGYALSESFAQENVTLVCNGTACELTYFSVSDEDIGTAIFKLPVLDAIPLVIPFTKVVGQGGSIAPSKGEFELVVSDLYEDHNYSVKQFDVDELSFSTVGTGETGKYFTICHDDFDYLLNFLAYEGFIVREKNSGADGWSYDDVIWHVGLSMIPEVNSLTDGVKIPYNYELVFTELKDCGNGTYEALTDPLDTMTFTNVYTKNETVTPPETTVKPSPDTGDNTHVVLGLAVLLAACAGVAGKSVYSKKRNNVK